MHAVVGVIDCLPSHIQGPARTCRSNMRSMCGTANLPGLGPMGSVGFPHPPSQPMISGLIRIAPSRPGYVRSGWHRSRTSQLQASSPSTWAWADVTIPHWAKFIARQHWKSSALAGAENKEDQSRQINLSDLIFRSHTQLVVSLLLASLPLPSCRYVGVLLSLTDEGDLASTLARPSDLPV
jgi:hypothetical protein